MWKMEPGKADSLAATSRVRPTLCLAVAPTRVPFSHLYVARHEHQPCSAHRPSPHHRAASSAQECARGRRWCILCPRSAGSPSTPAYGPRPLFSQRSTPAGTRSPDRVALLRGISLCLPVLSRHPSRQAHRTRQTPQGDHHGHHVDHPPDACPRPAHRNAGSPVEPRAVPSGTPPGSSPARSCVARGPTECCSCHAPATCRACRESWRYNCHSMLQASTAETRVRPRTEDGRITGSLRSRRSLPPLFRATAVGRDTPCMPCRAGTYWLIPALLTRRARWTSLLCHT